MKYYSLLLICASLLSGSSKLCTNNLIALIDAFYHSTVYLQCLIFNSERLFSYYICIKIYYVVFNVSMYSMYHFIMERRGEEIQMIRFWTFARRKYYELLQNKELDIWNFQSFCFLIFKNIFISQNYTKMYSTIKFNHF